MLYEAFDAGEDVVTVDAVPDDANGTYVPPPDVKWNHPPLPPDVEQVWHDR